MSEMVIVSETSSVLKARNGLIAAVRAALTADRSVDIEAGFSGAPENPDWVAFGDVDQAVDPKTIGPRRSYDETITLAMNVGAWRPGRGDAVVNEAYARCDELLSTIWAYIADGDNITLGGAVAWCWPGSASWVGAEVEGGFQVEVAAEFVCTHRVRAA